MKTSRSVLSIVLAALVVSSVAGCVADDASPAPESAEDDVSIAKDPLAVPAAIRKWEKQQDWGMHHLQWHTVRGWDRLDKASIKWATKKGWSRADLQEGVKGNGLEFLAMHRVMIRMVRAQFPKHAALFDGWKTVPTDPLDAQDPLPEGSDEAFDANMLRTLDRLTTDLEAFESDDDIGLYIETKARPTTEDPRQRTDDKSAGIHNYLHNRWADENSKVDLGDPMVNLQNKRFWRLHGWLDARWTAYREAKGLSDNDPTYAAAMAAAEHEMTHMHAPRGVDPGGAEPPPDGLRHFFRNAD